MESARPEIRRLTAAGKGFQISHYHTPTRSLSSFPEIMEDYEPIGFSCNNINMVVVGNSGFPCDTLNVYIYNRSKEPMYFHFTMWSMLLFHAFLSASIRLTLSCLELSY